MSEKKIGRMKFYNNRGRFGILIEDNGRETRVSERSFLGHPLSDGKVYYKITKTNKGTEISEIEGYHAYYFKRVVLNLEEHDYDEFCDMAKDYAIVLNKGKVTTSQIRKVYSQIYRAQTIKEIKRLRPQFAYIAGRQANNQRLFELMEILDHLAKHAETDSNREQDQLENLKTFMEAIVAYLKYVGE